MLKNKNFKKLLTVAIVCYLAFIFISQEITSIKIKKQIAKENSQLEILKSENQNLKDSVSLSKTEGYVEKIAREKLGLIKPNEKPVIDDSQSQK